MIAIVIALFAFVLAGFGLTYWLQRNSAARLANQPQPRGADQLAKLHWREFAKLVLQAMHARGFDPVIEDGMPADGIPTNGSDILLERDGERTLLSCKYGTASVVGAAPLLGLSKAATLRGATRVIVVTPGRFDEEATRLALQQDIELIDGETLWPEVRPYVASAEEPTPPAPTAAQKRNPQLLAWGGAAMIGALVWALALALLPEGGAADDMPPPPPTIARVGATAPAPKAMEAIPTDPAQLEQRRREAANAISTLFGVDRALWSTQSTLLVYLSSENADPMNELCPLLERYPELASSRLQLQPPAGSKKPVRFKQCRTY
ncbi:restriction endonuclease [Thermomonas alba]|uniref:restriction endonuclease n=1 Tax=Thermomonas alba TaxID=2888525 RepID=UPI001F0470F1|nr:restriction endonuclease [Thermomonas alba]